MNEKLKEYWDNKFITKGMIWGTEPSPITEKAIETFHKYECETICDLGCGYGRDSFPLARAGLDVIGLDLSPAAIGMGHERAIKENVSIDFRLIENLPVLAEPIHGIFCSNLLQLLNKAERSQLISWVFNTLDFEGIFCGMFLSSNDKQEYGKGTKTAPDTFASDKDGRVMYFYPEYGVIHDFHDFLIRSLEEIPYTENFADGTVHHHTMWSITCQKY
ncbi:MAG: class I SAM-dependent methyltransferase [bacterium]